jgi:probable FeS assembly SUF system protein SufT
LSQGDSVRLVRDVQAIIVPAGETVVLREGETAHVTQTLGGGCTVVVNGNMFRIDRRDMDALGVTTQTKSRDAAFSGTVEEDRIWEAMRHCFDPEIPVNIVDLGLVYDCALEPLPEGGAKVGIKMTLTAPGCGMGSTIARDVEDRVLEVPGVKEVHVELVWDPPWNQEMMSEAARLELGLL